MALPPAREVWDWARFTAVIGSRVYRAMFLTLAVLALAPMLVGWSSYVVHSGSMQPSIAVGDVALGRPFDRAEKVAVGRVYTFQDPTTSRERVLLHRIVERRDDGGYTTAGDANDVTDLTPLRPGGIEARAILLVPYVGLPMVWLAAGNWGAFTLWLLFTVAAFLLATRRIDGDPPPFSLGRLARALRRTEQTSDRPAAGSHSDRPPRPQPVARRFAAGIGGVLALCLIGTTLGTANAAFTARSRTSGNTWTAGAGLQPYAAAVLASNPDGFWMLDQSGAIVTDRTGTWRDGYLLGAVQSGVDGALPGNPGTAVRFNGGRVQLHPFVTWPSSSYSIEMWIRTTSTQEGYLAGYESSTNNTSMSYNRTVHMDAQGRLVMGSWPAWIPSTVTTPRSYNDGLWHHVVATGTPSGVMSAAQIYVDGVLVASGQTPSVDGFLGYWRLGSGSAPGAWGTTRHVTYRGDMDAVALYDRVLTAAEVAAHYAAR